MTRYIASYWGKARPANAGVQWHPLAYHSLDVAASMQALLEARPQWVKNVAELTQLSEEETKKRLILVAALHDLGKFAENFQWKVPALAEIFQHEVKNSNANHGSIGQLIWERINSSLQIPYLDDWIYAAASHHGTPVERDGNLSNACSAETLVEIKIFIQDILSLIGHPNEEKPARKNHQIWRIAGLVILADWVGSNQIWFDYCAPKYTLPEYWNIAKGKAQQAIIDAKLPEAECASLFDLSMLLGESAQPSPLQAWAESQQPENKAQLYIIEDLTGAGKTEAALILAHRLMKVGAAEGMYWALPSMATANSLYQRLEHHYRKLFNAKENPSLVLAHSARDLHESFQWSISKSETLYPIATEGDIPAEASCSAFIAEDRKKTFLAQFGIGTLDQALLSALPVRHQSLRLAALSRRVLIVDEAHAYDAYMTDGLEALLKLHKSLGGSAIILSATLTKEQRARFIQAYGGTKEAVTSTAFPLVTHFSASEVKEFPQEAARGTRRDLAVKRFDHPKDVMHALLEKVREGYACVYIRNTVKEALDAYHYFQEQHVAPHIFHARFTLGDRMAHENSVLKRFGKNSTENERQGQLLVATQVVEQSLDIDFDFMATDLCPMDLLIQRAGRLQRHPHRPSRPIPELWVVSSSTSNPKESWYSDLFHYGQYVYPHVGQLWRTMRRLEETGGIYLETGSPRGLIEPVFGNDPLETPLTLEAQSDKAKTKYTDAPRAIAKLNFLKLDDFIGSAEAWADDIYTPTRLGELSLTIRLAKWENGILSPWINDDNPDRAWRLSEMSIRSSLCEAVLPPNEEAAKAIDIINKDWKKRYDPPPILALMQTEQEGIWQGQWKNPEGKCEQVFYSSQYGLQV